MNARPAFAPDIAEAARQLGKLGGRPRGSFSPLGRWLRSEIKQRHREGYACREAFQILRDTEDPAGRDAFAVRDHTADDYGLDIGARVTWANFRKIWATETALCGPHP
jgi:hypothetical protein